MKKKILFIASAMLIMIAFISSSAKADRGEGLPSGNYENRHFNCGNGIHFSITCDGSGGANCDYTQNCP